MEDRNVTPKLRGHRRDGRGRPPGCADRAVPVDGTERPAAAGPGDDRAAGRGAIRAGRHGAAAHRRQLHRFRRRSRQRAIRAAGIRGATTEQRQRAALHEELEQLPLISPLRGGEAAAGRQSQILGDWPVDRARVLGDDAGVDPSFDAAYWRKWAILEATDAELDDAHERALRDAKAAGTGGAADLDLYRDKRLQYLQDTVTDRAHAVWQQDQQRQGRLAAGILGAPLDAGPALEEADIADLQGPADLLQPRGAGGPGAEAGRGGLRPGHYSGADDQRPHLRHRRRRRSGHRDTVGLGRPTNRRPRAWCRAPRAA